MKGKLEDDVNNKNKTTKKQSRKNFNKKKKIVMIIAIASLMIMAICVLGSIISAVVAPFSATSDVIDNFSDSDESLTDSEKDLIDESYKDYLCNDKEDVKCSERYDSYIESQKDFMDRFKKISKRYNLTKRQQKILYQTIVFGYSIEEITPGDVYDIDTTSDNDSENIYEEEKDTIKRLAELFNGSEQNYYNTLINDDDFFDDRKSCQNYYKEYATFNNLNPDNVKSWDIGDKQKVRKKIVKDIKSLVGEYLDDKKSTAPEIHTVTNNTRFWWPIGSSFIDKMLELKKQFAYSYENPLRLGISSNFGYRTDPITGKVQSFHDGIDIPAALNTAVISAQSGTVIKVYNSCSTTNSKNCPSGYGNHIKIKTDQNYTNIYAHLARDSMTVKVGDRVEQGQVIAGVGSSGKSTGYHLHFSFINEAGNFVNPLELVDPKEPRPVSYTTDSGSSEFPEKWNNLYKFISYNEGGFSNSNKVECEIDGIPTSRYGMVLKYRVDDFAKHGYTLTTQKGDYSEYCGKELPNDVTKAVFVDLLEYWEGYIKGKAARSEITLNKVQMDALIDLSWSGYEAIDKFFEVYKNYGNNDSLCTSWWNTWYVNSSAAASQGYDVRQGLINRRTRECKLFVHGDYGIALSK